VQANVTIPNYTVQGRGEPLVLIMGLGGPKEAWGFQANAFKRHYRVITFDNRGVGQTAVGQQAITVEVMADDTLALLDHLGIDSAHILGYSLGGLVAQEIAIRHPERVKKLILVSTVAIGAEPDEISAGMAKRLGLEPAGSQRDVTSADLQKLMRLVAERSFNRWAFRTVMRFQLTLMGFLLRHHPGRMKGGDGLAAQFMAAASANTLERLGSIQARTLVLTGAGDRLVDPEASRVLASRIPNAKLVMIEGGSHAFAIEMRRQFNRAVLEFLAEK
jgi:3-oxoadipate enol-lactonase